nr:hypothetical protein BCU37_17620 [Vibrio splendidus]PMJ95684.1 hypothetical protein BCU10_06665 [Vibrio splendidus]PMK51605.1 hypothetical protein BCT96_09285 [Vibrio splendidus]
MQRIYPIAKCVFLFLRKSALYPYINDLMLNPSILDSPYPFAIQDIGLDIHKKSSSSELLFKYLA